MSRSLDGYVSQFIFQNPAEVAKLVADIALALNPPSPNYEKLPEIEILGTSHLLDNPAHLQQDGNSIGISKVGLVQAFQYCRDAFTVHAQMPKEELNKLRCIPDCLTLLLLMDPENLTAANLRKRIVDNLIYAEIQLCPRDILYRELYFTDSLLTSRLYRHNKSPTLWSHRRWLIQQCRIIGVPINAESAMRKVILLAGDRHPRNYYAWNHARWLYTVPKPSIPGDLVKALESWCLCHHDDISGWTFLHWILKRLPEPAKGDLSRAVFIKAMANAGKLHWGNESVWIFLHSLGESIDLHCDIRLAYETVRLHLVALTMPGSHEERILKRAELKGVDMTGHCDSMQAMQAFAAGLSACGFVVDDCPVEDVGEADMTGKKDEPSKA